MTKGNNTPKDLVRGRPSDAVLALLDQQQDSPNSHMMGWRCDECGCHSGAFIDERKADGSFGPGQDRRCENCKKVHVATKDSPSSQVMGPTAEQERLRFEGDLDKWMKMIGAGITGSQPEAYAIMDHACGELVRARVKIEQLRSALGAFVGGLENWADENGWTDKACQNDRISTWVGPGDWLTASVALSATAKEGE